MRQTRQKQLILDACLTYQGHPSAEDLYAILKPEHPRLSLATVYRNLNRFADQGLIGRVELPSGPTRFDHTATPHHHAVCEHCGALVDIDAPNRAELEAAIQRMGPLKVTRYNLILYGICPDCQAKMADGPLKPAGH